MTSAENVLAEASRAEKEHQWEMASDLFLLLAHSYKDSKEFELAAEFFMRAAISRERCEDWRRLGHIWVQCGSCLENRPTGAVADIYDQVEASSHFFPTLDLYAWQRFSTSEKIGRAFRNAAYHLEKAGSNQSAYVQYGKSGDVFRDGGMYAEASRSYYHGLLAIIERNGELDSGRLRDLELANLKLVEENDRKYLKRMQLHYRGLAGKLISKGNYEQAVTLSCKECEVARHLAKTDHRFGRWITFTFWKYTSYYGNSFWLWAAWAFSLFVVAFPILFMRSGSLEWQDIHRVPRFLDYVFFSVMTVTTASDTSFGMTPIGKLIVIVEGIIGFLLLGSLLTLFAKKTVR